MTDAETETGLTEKEDDPIPCLFKVEAERKDDVFLVAMTVSGVKIPTVTMNMDEILSLKADISDSIEAISKVTAIDPCPLCRGTMDLVSRVVPFPMGLVGGRFVCTNCGLSMDSPFKTVTDSISWWNGGRKLVYVPKKRMKLH